MIDIFNHIEHNSVFGFLKLWKLVILSAIVILLLSTLYRVSKPTTGLGTFKKRPLLNKTETKLAHILDTYAQNHGLRVLAQVSYGEFISNPNSKSFWKINAKRADLVLADRNFDVVAVIELLGSGHFGNTSDKRRRAEASDDIKQYAVTSAGIPFIFIQQDYTNQKVVAELDKALGNEQASADK